MFRDQLAAARACRAWTELDREQLVERGRYFVHAQTDAAVRVYRGDAFAPSGAVLSDQTPLYFYAGADGEPVMLEKQPQPWTEIVYRMQRARTAAAPPARRGRTMSRTLLIRLALAHVGE
jgi:hypothetical protein